jgi:PKD repeat protein
LKSDILLTLKIDLLNNKISFIWYICFMNKFFLFSFLFMVLLSCQKKCEAEFTVSNSTPAVGDNVKFSASQGCGNNSTYQWTFGDGNGGEGMDVMHIYTTAGSYTVKLTVGNKTMEKTITVQ